jgi:hypothetical protein
MLFFFLHGSLQRMMLRLTASTKLLVCRRVLSVCVLGPPKAFDSPTISIEGQSLPSHMSLGSFPPRR